MIATAANTARRLVRGNPHIPMSDLINRVAADAGVLRPVAIRAVQLAFPQRC